MVISDVAQLYICSEEQTMLRLHFKLEGKLKLETAIFSICGGQWWTKYSDSFTEVEVPTQ